MRFRVGYALNIAGYDSSMPSVELISERALSRYLDVPRNTLRRWRRLGKGPPWVRIGVRMIRYDTAHLCRWLEQQQARRALGLDARLNEPVAKGGTRQ